MHGAHCIYAHFPSSFSLPLGRPCGILSIELYWTQMMSFEIDNKMLCASLDIEAKGVPFFEKIKHQSTHDESLKPIQLFRIHGLYEDSPFGTRKES